MIEKNYYGRRKYWYFSKWDTGGRECMKQFMYDLAYTLVLIPILIFLIPLLVLWWIIDVVRNTYVHY